MEGVKVGERWYGPYPEYFATEYPDACTVYRDFIATSGLGSKPQLWTFCTKPVEKLVKKTSQIVTLRGFFNRFNQLPPV